MKADRNKAIEYVNALTRNRVLVDSASIVHESDGLIEFCTLSRRHPDDVRQERFESMCRHIDEVLGTGEKLDAKCRYWKIGIKQHVEVLSCSIQGIVVSLCDRN